MFEAASILGPCLLVLALMDTKARLMALLLWLVWGEAALFDLMVSVDMAVIMKPLIDFTGGIMALGIVRRERWSVMVPALFAVMMLCHAAYWLAWHNGIDLWYVYAHALTAFWLFQCAAVAWPSGGRLVGLVGSRIGDLLAYRRWRHRSLSTASYEVESQADRPAHVRAGSDVFVSSRTRV